MLFELVNDNVLDCIKTGMTAAKIIHPVFYRAIQGSVVDKTAFVDTVNAAGCSGGYDFQRVAG